MKYLVCILITFLLPLAEAKIRKSTEKDLQDAQKILQRLGVDLRKVKMEKKDIDWRSSCGGDDVEVGDPEAILMFDAVSVQPMEFMGYSLGKEAKITICDGKVHGITSGVSSERIVFKKDGYECDSYIELDSEGHLCQCRFAKDTVVNGFMVPKGARSFFRKGIFYATLLDPDSDKRLKGFGMAYYKIENGKPIMLKIDSLSCEFSERKNP